MIVMDNLTPQGRKVGKARPISRGGKGAIKGSYATTFRNKYKGPKPRSSTSWS